MFDSSERFPWEQASPSPLGTVVPRASEQGSYADPVLSHPTFPQANPVTGALIVDPDIHLKAKGFNLELSFFYNSRSDTNGPYGKKRSFSANCYVLRGNDADHIQVVRGDENIYVFAPGSTVGSIKNYTPDPKQYAGTTLVYDSSVTSFIETFPDGKQMIYGANQGGVDFTKFALTRIQDPSGNRHTYTYGTGVEANLLKSIQVPGGNLLTLTYQAATGPTSLVNAVQDWGGRITTLQYDANRQLTTMTTPLGCMTKYAYAHAGASEDMLNVIEDSRGYATTYMYDSVKRVTTVAAGSGIWTNTYGGIGLGWSGSAKMEPNGAVTTYLVTNGRISNVQHPEGYTTTYEYDGNGYQTKQIEPYGTISSVSHNSSGLPLVAYDALGYATTYQYDASLNLTTVTDALGNISSFTYDGTRRMTARIDPLGRRTTYAWNGDGTLQAMQDGRGLRTTNAYDASGNLASILNSDGSVITYGYDSLNRRTSSQLPGNTVATSIVYDVADHVIAMVDLVGARSTSVYDSCLLVASVNPFNERTTYTYNRFRSRETVMNPLGFVSTWVYDNMNRPTGAINALGYRTTQIYSGSRKVADMDALGNLTSYSYDASNRPSAVQDARGNFWTNVYDARNLIARMDPLGNLSTSVYDKVNRQVASVSPLGLVSTSVYDAAGQLSASITPMGFITSFQYDGNRQRTVVQDANNKLTTTAYFSNRNLPESVTDAMGFKTTYAYDQQSRLVSTRDANGGYVTNLYDTAGRLQFVQNQLGQNARQYGYDLAGRVVTMADAANRVKSLTYDVNGQNLATQFPDGTIATFGYDAIGQRTTMSDWGGVSTYAYDPRSQMSGKTDPASVQAYGYDSVGNRTTLILSGTGTFTSTFDSLNRPYVSQKPDGLLYTVQYDADSRRTTLLLGQGSRRQFAFDANSKLTTQIELNTSNVQICTIIDSYDNVGNRMTQSVDATTATWTYDNIYRLTGQTKPNQVATYVMDPVGNLLVMWEGGANPKTMTYDVIDRITTMAEGANLTTYTYTSYNALGSEITGNQTTAYAYSGQDQLTGVTDPGGVTSTYTFDGNALRRTAQEGNVLPTTMVWEGSDYLQIVGPSTPQTVLTVESEILASGSVDLLTDPLGSLVKEISGGATLGSLIENYPYGKAVSGTGTPTTPWVYVAKYGYYKDSADRDYVRARELYRTLGRWIQVDPLWPRQDSYHYCRCSPNTNTDPDGSFALVAAAPVVFGGPLAWGICAIVVLGGAAWYCCTRRDECQWSNDTRTCTQITLDLPWLTINQSYLLCIALRGCKDLRDYWSRLACFESCMREAVGGGPSIEPPHEYNYDSHGAIRQGSGTLYE